MKKLLWPFVRRAPFIWAAMATEIFVTSLLYAILSTAGVGKALSFLITLGFGIVLVFLSFLLYSPVLLIVGEASQKKEKLTSTKMYSIENVAKYANAYHVHDETIRLLLSLIAGLLAITSVIVFALTWFVGNYAENDLMHLWSYTVLLLVIPFFLVVKYYFRSGKKEE